MKKTATASAVTLLTLLSTPVAANGRFPSAGQIVVHPEDPARVVIRATYGILATNTGAAPFGLVCEQAVGYGDNQDPAMAITQDGSLLAGVVDGLSISHDGGCSWSFANEIGDVYVLDVSTVRADPSRAVALTYGPNAGGESVTQVWKSDDDGRTWTRAGVDLPAGFFGVTLDVAAGPPERIYVSGRYGMPDYLGALIRSDDGGETWTSLDVPDTSQEAIPYIGAIDPGDADRVYLRLDAEPDDRLVVTKDAGESFETAHLAMGPLLAFAVSPDGATVVMGGEDEGVLRASAADLSFARVSDVAPRCFSWTSEGLWTCADEFRDAFTVGLSTDSGETFEPRMHLQTVCDLIECPAGTPVADTCPPYLGKVQLTLKVTECGAPSGSGAGPNATDTDTGEGCSCETVAARAPSRAPLAIACALLGLVAARRRRDDQKSPPPKSPPPKSPPPKSPPPRSSPP